MERGPLDRTVQFGPVHRAHQGLRGAQPGGGDRGRGALLAEHGHHGLADAEAGEEFFEVVGGVREGLHRRLQGLLVVRREGPERVLDPVAELREDVGRHVLRGLCDEEDAHAFRANQAHGLGDRVQERLGGVAEQQVRLVEEEHQPGLVGVADLGQVVEEVGQQPHQERREEQRFVLDRGQFQDRDDAPSVGRRPQQVGRVELGLAEEVRHALRLEGGQRAQDHPGRGGGQAADVLQLGPALVGDQERDDRPEVLEVDQLQALGVGVVEDQAEGLLLGPVELQHLGEQDRAEAGDGGPHRDTAAEPAEGEELGGETGRRPLLSHLGGAPLDPAVRPAGLRDAGQVALDVREEHRHALRGELLGDQLEGLRLARAGRARDQSVPVEHGQRDAHRRVRAAPTVPQEGAEVEGGAGEGVSGSDLLSLRGERLAVTHLRPLFPINTGMPVWVRLFQRRTASPWLRPERLDR